MGTEDRSSPGARFSLLDATTTLRPPLLKKLLSNIEDGGAAPFSGAPRCAHVSLVFVLVVHADTYMTEDGRKREKDSRGMECILLHSDDFLQIRPIDHGGDDYTKRHHALPRPPRPIEIETCLSFFSRHDRAYRELFGERATT